MARPTIAHRRRRVLDAAENLLLGEGFAAMGIQRIADRVGIAKGAVYLEFDSKDAILDELVRRHLARLARGVRQQLEGHSAGLGEGYRRLLLGLLDDRLLTAVFLDDRELLGAYAARSEGERHQRHFIALVAYLAALREGGALRPDLNPGPVALALSATTVGFLALGRALGPQGRDALEEAVDAVADLVERGLENADGSADPGAWTDLVMRLSHSGGAD